MENSVATENVLKELKCTNCKRYISVGPVKLVSSKHVCGRCPIEGGEVNAIYEKLAQLIRFPCIYDELGCDKTFPFGEEMKLHESSCFNKPISCPVGLVENCKWQGQNKDMLEHAKINHPARILDKPEVEIDLSVNTEKRCIFAVENVVFIMDIIFNSKHLSVVVMQFSTNVKNALNKCEMVLNPSGKLLPTITFPKNVREYRCIGLPSDDDVIDANVVKCIDKGKVLVRITVQFNIPSTIEVNTVKKEVVAKPTIFTCKHFAYSCLYIDGDAYKIKEHEDTCVVLECPLKSQKCTWKGTRNVVKKHCLDVHGICESQSLRLQDLMSAEEPVLFYLLQKTVYCPYPYVTQVKCHVSIRVGFKLNTDEKLMYISIQHIDSKEYSRVTVNFSNNGGLNSDITVENQELTRDDNAFDNCTCISYKDMLESTIITISFR